MTGRSRRPNQGGQHALAGFDYQATVILDVLLGALETWQNVRVRPEGEDDLVLWHQETQEERRIFYQVKKPSQSGNGIFLHHTWTLLRAADSLLPQTLQNLEGNVDRQLWILGDAVSTELRALLDAGAAALTTHRSAYLQLLHFAARQHSGLSAKVSKRWFAQIPAHLSIPQIADLLQQEAHRLAITADTPEVTNAHRTAFQELHVVLPDVLARTEAHSTFGSEQDVQERVQHALHQRFGIDLEVVHYTLFRNIRGFINDVSKQPGRTIDAADLEDELRNVWPHLNVVGRVPPNLPKLPRQGLVASILLALQQGPTAIMGVSGSGKSALTTLIARTVAEREPGREVFYAAVRAGHSVRDVLTGLAYFLRRFGESRPFSVAVDRRLPDDEVVTRVADTFSRINVPVTLLVDLTEGTVNDEFSRQAAHLVRALKMSSLQIAFLAHENALSELSDLERRALRLPSPVHVPGLTFDEFVLLARPQTPTERADLHTLYHHLTAGRAAGLPAVQAALLADEPPERWVFLSQTPPEEALRLAEERRFGSLPARLQPTADRLVCFFLPFNPAEAQAIFPDLPVNTTIRELRRKGLLIPSASGRLEIHETVRRGLESLVPPRLHRETHAVLAEHYRARSQLSATIHHLMQSGALEEARTLARTAFFTGNHLAEVRDFVLQQRLVEPRELLPLLEQAALPSLAFLWTEILAQGGPETAQALLDLLRRHPGRLGDYAWTTIVIGGMVRADPEILAPLTRFILAVVDERARNNLIQTTALEARRARCVVSPTVVAVFDQSPLQSQIQLLPLILIDPNRESLGCVVSLYQRLGAEPQDEHGRFKGLARPGGHYLITGAHIEALLSVLPDPPPGLELALTVPQFGGLSDWLWAERAVLGEHSATLLADPFLEPRLALNAMRILVFLGDERIGTLARLHQEDADPAGPYAMLAPIFSPEPGDAVDYRAALLDPTASMERRIAHLAVLFRLEADPDQLLDDLLQADPQHVSTWQFWFLLQGSLRPFPGLVSLLREHLADEVQPWTTALVSRLTEIESVAAEDLLLECAVHPSPEVRAVAVQCLAYVRRPDSRPTLLAAHDQGTHEKLLWFAALGSRPTSPNDLAPFLALLPETERPLWQAVAAARLGDTSQGPFVAGLARDPAQPWQVRRAALLAAGHLPYDDALAACAEVVLDEPLGFASDLSPSLISHKAVAIVLAFDPDLLLRLHHEGEERFLTFVGDMIDMVQRRNLFPSSSLPPVDVAHWLYQNIAAHLDSVPSPLFATANAVHLPILQAAVYRGYRLAGRIDLLENEVATPRSEWHLMRALCECRKVPGSDFDRLRTLVHRGPYASSISATNALRPPAPQSPGVPASTTHTHVTGPEIVAFLAGTPPPPGPYLFTRTDGEPFTELADLLDPALDGQERIDILEEPRMSLTSAGPMVEEQRSSRTYVPSVSDMRDRLRAAFVAAVYPDVPVWHTRQIGGFVADNSHGGYIDAYLQALAAREGTQTFHEEVRRYGVPLLLALCGSRGHGVPPALVDVRLSPFLLRAVHAGPDTLLRSLCQMVGGLRGEEAHPVLTVLASRCIRWVRSAGMKVEDFGSSLALMALLEHPETLEVPTVRSALISLAEIPLPNHVRRALLQSLSKCPQAYPVIERLLIRSVDFEHYLNDEVDELDDAAQTLF